MLKFLLSVTLACFSLSYAITLVLEVSRLFFRLPVRMVVMASFAALGLLTHTLFLARRMQEQVGAGVPVPLSSGFDWCLTAAWVLAAAYFGLLLRRPQNMVGLFLLPLVLALIGVAWLVGSTKSFSASEATGYWRMIHGVALLLGTAAVSLGFATGLMYLYESFRLKHKRPIGQRLKLPSLEWLQRFNYESVFLSALFLSVGLLSGIVLNVREKAIAWTNLSVVVSGVLFLWLVVVTLFESLYKPARQGRKVAYLTLASFVFLGVALLSVLFGEHGGRP